MKTFQDKVAVITGAGSGIGRGLVLELAKAGAKIMASDINEKSLAETKQLAKQAGAEISTASLDVANRDAVYAYADDVKNRAGGADLVINNAGVAQVAAVQELSLEDLEWVMGINYYGVVYGTQAFLPQLQEKKAGHIVNISSIFGLIGVLRQAAYCSAKFAVLGYTESLRCDMREYNTLEKADIGISVVHPGGIKTNIARTARHNQGPDLAERQKAMTDGFDEMTITTPEKAAQIILRGVRKNKPRIRIGRDAVMVDWIRRVFPANYWRFLAFGRPNEDNPDVPFASSKKD